MYATGLEGLSGGLSGNPVGHWLDADGKQTTDWTQNNSSDPRTIEQNAFLARITSLLPFINKIIGMDGQTVADFVPVTSSEKYKFDQKAWVWLAGPFSAFPAGPAGQNMWAGVAPVTGAIHFTGGTTDPVTGKVIPLDATATPGGVTTAKGSAPPPPVAPPVTTQPAPPTAPPGATAPAGTAPTPAEQPPTSTGGGAAPSGGGGGAFPMEPPPPTDTGGMVPTGGGALSFNLASDTPCSSP